MTTILVGVAVVATVLLAGWAMAHALTAVIMAISDAQAERARDAQSVIRLRDEVHRHRSARYMGKPIVVGEDP